MALTKKKEAEIQRLGKAAETTHRLFLNLKKEFIDLGIDEESVVANLNSLILGDITTTDFIEFIKEEIEYLEG